MQISSGNVSKSVQNRSNKVTALVVGATGFIGRRLITPADIAFVRKPSGYHNEIIGDLLAADTLKRACQSVDTVFHCAGYAHAFTSSDPDTHWRINYEGTRNLIQAAGDAGVRRFIFLSSVKAMGEPGDVCANEEWPVPPDTPYGKAKRAAENAVLEMGGKFGMHVVNLRLTMVYGYGGRGNLERMARGILAGWFPPLPETGNKRSIVHVDDVIAAIRLVAERREALGQTYILASAEAWSGAQIYDMLREAQSMPSIAWRVPPQALKMAGAFGDICGATLGRSMPVNSEIVDRLLGSACYTPQKIETELGWRASVDFYRGAKEMLGLEALN
jgi:UDP-glucose 4-epimerase